jgi:thymidylate synthase (FAD)
MIVITPKVKVYFHVPVDEDGNFIQQQLFLERVARTCYKSEDKIQEGSAQKMIKMLKGRGHHAMLEHCFGTVHIITDRGVSHEAVRHRIASFAQESTRYCNYIKGKFGGQISIIHPEKEMVPEPFYEEMIFRRNKLYEQVEEEYKWEIENGITPQIARGVLPTALKTELWITANLREWMHIFNLRLDPAAHPQMIQVMEMAYIKFNKAVPELFSKEDSKF